MTFLSASTKAAGVNLSHFVVLTLKQEGTITQHIEQWTGTSWTFNVCCGTIF